MIRRLTMASVVMATIMLPLGLAARGSQEKSGQNTAAAELDAFVEKVIKAHGGEQLAKIKAQTWKDKGVYYGMGEGRPFTGSYAMQIPDKFRMEIPKAFTIVVNGDKGWFNGTEMAKDQIAQQREANYAGWVTTRFPLKDKSLTVTLLDETDVSGRPTVGILAASKGHRDIKIYFDKKTGLMAKSVTRIMSREQGGKEVEQEVYFSGYKDQSGIAVPMNFTVKQDGKLYLEGEITEWLGAEKLDDSIFAQPKGAKPQAAGADQFDYLIGEWRFTAKTTARGVPPEFSGTWKAWKIDDGRGVMDEFRALDDKGNAAYYGLTIRTWDADRGRWRITFVDRRPDGKWGQLQTGEATFKAGAMHLVQSGTDKDGSFIWRIRYYDIGPDRFSWQADRSRDDGKTWAESVTRIEARRIAADAGRR